MAELIDSSVWWIDDRYDYSHDDLTGHITIRRDVKSVRTISLPFNTTGSPEMLIDLDADGYVVGVESLHGAVTLHDLCTVIESLRSPARWLS